LQTCKAAGENPTEHHQAEIPDFTKSFPPNLVECNSGVCIYFNPDDGQEIVQDFLFRRHKGHFYRKRYPTISFMNVSDKTF